MKSYMIFVGMGFEITALIVGSVFLGSALDKHWGTKGYFVAGLIIVSLIGWITRVLFLLAKIQKEEESKDRAHRELP